MWISSATATYDLISSGRSQKEIDEDSPAIVSTKGARGDEVNIETGLATSTLGVYTLPPTRTYPFDKVFGAEADQAMVYNDVVAPILEEVISGYNCTLFAYGQTGTGKTHTMQGDLTPTITGAPCSDAGMIPRVLAKLYQHLEKSVADYSVKISYIELYNEELRDLLANDLAAPAASTQPMDRAANAGGVPGGLKIFDEAGQGKRGVVIQGLEEIAVKNATSAIALLRKGSHRRQIAATKFNDHSSRSHSIFTITVHTKETSSKGDDLLRVGKLNLVDLAGSENVGRSGAENKRAREAGMINQSLLTLGRVISALVEKSPHIPYRYAMNCISSFNHLLTCHLESQNSLACFKTPSVAARKHASSRPYLPPGPTLKKRSRHSTMLFRQKQSATNPNSTSE